MAKTKSGPTVETDSDLYIIASYNTGRSSLSNPHKFKTRYQHVNLFTIFDLLGSAVGWELTLRRWVVYAAAYRVPHTTAEDGLLFRIRRTYSESS